MDWIAHLTYLRGRLSWSGYGATGDRQRHKIAFRVDIGSEFQLDNDAHRDGLLIVPRVDKLNGFTPESLLLAARRGMFGFKVMEEMVDAPEIKH